MEAALVNSGSIYQVYRGFFPGVKHNGAGIEARRVDKPCTTRPDRMKHAPQPKIRVGFNGNLRQLVTLKRFYCVTCYYYSSCALLQCLYACRGLHQHKHVEDFKIFRFVQDRVVLHTGEIAAGGETNGLIMRKQINDNYILPALYLLVMTTAYAFRAVKRTTCNCDIPPVLQR